MTVIIKYIFLTDYLLFLIYYSTLSLVTDGSKNGK